ncbi:glutathione S-transferase T3 [Capsella rubella]|nr:glutathione S-transferase T3 [Capsella rubella]
MSGSRSSGYSKEEDKFLCEVYLKISQDPITGHYQSSDHFWDRVVKAFEDGKNRTWSKRSKKSLQCRFQNIERATKKLHACIRQCENSCQSGVSSDDIFNQAKEMLMQDSRFKSGWKFDHVWNIIKDFEKFKNGVTSARKIQNPCDLRHTSSESENTIHDSIPSVSPGLSSFDLNLDEEDDIIGRSPPQQPSGVKKSKLKRKNYDETSNAIKTLDGGNKQLLEQLKKISEQRQQYLELQCEHLALKKLRTENKILCQNLSSIEDPNIRAYIQSEQAKILKKRVD